MKKYNLSTCQSSGHGHYKVGIEFRGKEYTIITNNMGAIDDYRSEVGERDGRELRVKRGYLALRDEIIRANDLR